MWVFLLIVAVRGIIVTRNTINFETEGFGAQGSAENIPREFPRCLECIAGEGVYFEGDGNHAVAEEGGTITVKACGCPCVENGRLPRVVDIDLNGQNVIPGVYELRLTKEYGMEQMVSALGRCGDRPVSGEYFASFVRSYEHTAWPALRKPLSWTGLVDGVKNLGSERLRERILDAGPNNLVVEVGKAVDLVEGCVEESGMGFYGGKRMLVEESILVHGGKVMDFEGVEEVRFGKGVGVFCSGAGSRVRFFGGGGGGGDKKLVLRSRECRGGSWGGIHISDGCVVEMENVVVVDAGLEDVGELQPPKNIPLDISLHVGVSTHHPGLPAVSVSGEGGRMEMKSVGMLRGVSLAFMVGSGGELSLRESVVSGFRLLVEGNDAKEVLIDSSLLQCGGPLSWAYEVCTLMARKMDGKRWDEFSLGKEIMDVGMRELEAKRADDNDLVYTIGGLLIVWNSVLRLGLDDGLDSGSGPGGVVLVDKSSIGFCAHEAVALSDSMTKMSKRAVITQSTLHDAHQCLELGFSTPHFTVRGDGLALVGCGVGVRFGDGYGWDTFGEMYVSNSIFLNNDRDVLNRDRRTSKPFPTFPTISTSILTTHHTLRDLEGFNFRGLGTIALDPSTTDSELEEESVLFLSGIEDSSTSHNPPKNYTLTPKDIAHQTLQHSIATTTLLKSSSPTNDQPQFLQAPLIALGGSTRKTSPTSTRSDPHRALKAYWVAPKEPESHVLILWSKAPKSSISNVPIYLQYLQPHLHLLGFTRLIRSDVSLSSFSSPLNDTDKFVHASSRDDGLVCICITPALMGYVQDPLYSRDKATCPCNKTTNHLFPPVFANAALNEEFFQWFYQSSYYTIHLSDGTTIPMTSAKGTGSPFVVFVEVAEPLHSVVPGKSVLSLVPFTAKERIRRWMLSNNFATHASQTPIEGVHDTCKLLHVAHPICDSILNRDFYPGLRWNKYSIASLVRAMLKRVSLDVLEPSPLWHIGRVGPGLIGLVSQMEAYGTTALSLESGLMVNHNISRELQGHLVDFFQIGSRWGSTLIPVASVLGSVRQPAFNLFGFLPFASCSCPWHAVGSLWDLAPEYCIPPIVTEQNYVMMENLGKSCKFFQQNWFHSSELRPLPAAGSLYSYGIIAHSDSISSRSLTITDGLHRTTVLSSLLRLLLAESTRSSGMETRALNRAANSFMLTFGRRVDGDDECVDHPGVFRMTVQHRQDWYFVRGLDLVALPVPCNRDATTGRRVPPENADMHQPQGWPVESSLTVGLIKSSEGKPPYSFTFGTSSSVLPRMWVESNQNQSATQALTAMGARLGRQCHSPWHLDRPITSMSHAAVAQLERVLFEACQLGDDDACKEYREELGGKIDCESDDSEATLTTIWRPPVAGPIFGGEGTLTSDITGHVMRSSVSFLSMAAYFILQEVRASLPHLQTAIQRLASSPSPCHLQNVPEPVLLIRAPSECYRDARFSSSLLAALQVARERLDTVAMQDFPHVEKSRTPYIPPCLQTDSTRSLPSCETEVWRSASAFATIAMQNLLSDPATQQAIGVVELTFAYHSSNPPFLQHTDPIWDSINNVSHSLLQPTNSTPVQTVTRILRDSMSSAWIGAGGTLPDTDEFAVSNCSSFV